MSSARRTKQPPKTGDVVDLPIRLLPGVGVAAHAALLRELLHHFAFDRGLCPITLEDVAARLEAVQAAAASAGGRHGCLLLRQGAYKRTVKFLRAANAAVEAVAPPVGRELSACTPATDEPAHAAWHAKQWALVIGMSATKPKEVITIRFCDTLMRSLSLSDIARQHQQQLQATEASAGERSVEEATSIQIRRVLRALLLAHETVAAWNQEPPSGKGVILIRAPRTEPSAVGCIPKPLLHLNGKRRVPQVDISLVCPGVVADQDSKQICWHQACKPIKPIKNVVCL